MLPREMQRKIGHLDDEVNMGNIDTVKALLENGADVNWRDMNGNTPLLAAANTGDAEMIRMLLSFGADREARGCDGLTAFELALEYVASGVGGEGHEEVAQVLREP